MWNKNICQHTHFAEVYAGNKDNIGLTIRKIPFQQLSLLFFIYEPTYLKIYFPY